MAGQAKKALYLDIATVSITWKYQRDMLWNMFFRFHFLHRESSPNGPEDSARCGDMANGAVANGI